MHAYGTTLYYFTSCMVWQSAALCLSSVPHLCCLHLSPFTFLENRLILFIPNFHFLSPAPFQSCTDVCVCFLWVLVWCRRRFSLPLFLLPFVFLCLCHTPSCSFIPSHSFVNLLLQIERMSILSSVPCTNHPHTDTVLKRGLAELKYVEGKYLYMCV